MSEGCEHCYAESFAKRTGHDVWGPKSERRAMSDSYWAQPLKWNLAAKRSGVRHRVFCSSMADVFEARDDLDVHRARLWKLIEATPWLDWQLLTKRPQNFKTLLPKPWLRKRMPHNVWLGVTVENQERANERLPILVSTPARVRFVSAEPLLGPVGLAIWLYHGVCEAEPGDSDYDAVDWVIVGGESGPGSRPFALDWARKIIADCKKAHCAVFFKQAGAHPIDPINLTGLPLLPEVTPLVQVLRLKDRKGGDLGELPPDLHVREFPETNVARWMAGTP